MPGYLIQDVMAFCPFWSSAVLPQAGRLSNAEVENHFLSVIRSRLTGSRLPVAEFVRDHYKLMKQRMKRIVSTEYLIPV